jgi:hypothetical protein
MYDFYAWRFADPVNAAKPVKPGLKPKKSTVPIVCPICRAPFLNSQAFLRHLTDSHFYDQVTLEQIGLN